MTSTPPEIGLTVAPDVAPLVRLGLVAAAPVRVAPSAPPLRAELDDLAARVAAAHAGKPAGSVAGVAPARALYRAFGIDPTRTRPSSEALLRRVLRGMDLPRILNAVDVCNLCSLRFLLPIGLYDAAKVRGAVVLRRGADGEAYPGIRKDDIHLGGRPLLADALGPFGNPTSDSLRSSVGEGTESLWMVIFAPPTVSPEMMAEHVRFARSAIERHLAGPGAPVRTAGAVGSDGSLHPAL